MAAESIHEQVSLAAKSDADVQLDSSPPAPDRTAAAAQHAAGAPEPAATKAAVIAGAVAETARARDSAASSDSHHGSPSAETASTSGQVAIFRHLRMLYPCCMMVDLESWFYLCIQMPIFKSTAGTRGGRWRRLLALRAAAAVAAASLVVTGAMLSVIHQCVKCQLREPEPASPGHDIQHALQCKRSRRSASRCCRHSTWWAWRNTSSRGAPARLWSSAVPASPPQQGASAPQLTPVEVTVPTLLLQRWHG